MSNSSIYLYQEEHYKTAFKGNPYEASIDHFEDDANSASSMRVIGGSWVLYSSADYEGDAHVITPGDYSKAEYFQAVGDDDLHSAQQLPATGICLFKKENFNGKFTHIEEGGSLEDVNAKSIIVLSGDWDLFLKANPGDDDEPTTSAITGNYPHNPSKVANKTIKAIKPSKNKGSIQISSETDAAAINGLTRLGNPPAIEILFDGSGSMDRYNRMKTAKTVLRDLIIHDIPEGCQIALRVFGTSGCQSELVYPLANFDQDNLLKVVDEIKPIGDTPLAAT